MKLWFKRNCPVSSDCWHLKLCSFTHEADGGSESRFCVFICNDSLVFRVRELGKGRDTDTGTLEVALMLTSPMSTSVRILLWFSTSDLNLRLSQLALWFLPMVTKTMITKRLIKC